MIHKALSKTLGKNHIACYSILHPLCIHFYKGEMVIDGMSLGMLCLARVVVFMGYQIQSFCSPITLHFIVQAS